MIGFFIFHPINTEINIPPSGNRIFEARISNMSNILNKEDFYWNSTFVLSTLSNKVVSLGGEERIFVQPNEIGYKEKIAKIADEEGLQICCL